MSRSGVSWFRTIIGWGLGIPVTGLITIVSLCSFLITRKGSIVHFSSRLWGRIILALAGIRVVINGRENLPKDGKPVIIVSNHQSLVDILVFSGYFPIRFAWIAKKELFKIPVLGTAMKAAGYIAIDRLQRQNAIHALEQAARQLKNHAVVIFPEGTRSKNGSVGRYKSGASFLASSSNAPLLPVTITGSWNRLPPNYRLIAPGTVEITIDPPVPTKGSKRREVFRELQKIRQKTAERVNESHLLTG